MRHSWISIFCPFDDLTYVPSSFSSSSPPSPPVAPDATGSLPSRYFVAMASRNVTPGSDLVRADERSRGGAVGGVGGALEVSRAAVRAVVLAPRGVVPLHAHPLAILAHDGSDVAHGGAGAVPRLDAATHLCIVWHHHHDVDAGCARTVEWRASRSVNPRARVCAVLVSRDAGQKFETTHPVGRARGSLGALLSRSGHTRARAIGRVGGDDGSTPKSRSRWRWWPLVTCRRRWTP